MGRENETFASEFILLGFTAWADLQVMFFVLFLAIYVIILMGSLGVIALIRINRCLHTPMYFFLSHLCPLDICYSSTIIPQTLRDFLTEKKVISFASCVTQLFSFATWATTEFHMLAAMAYNRYLQALLYSMLMSHRISAGMLAGASLAGVISSTLHTVSIFHAPFCRSLTIDHFFCNGLMLLDLSRSDSHASEAVVAAVVGFNVLSTTAFILVSYSSVSSAILQIHSAAGRHKAFSTCASHLACINLYYGSAILTYLRPNSSRSLEEDKVTSLVYSVAIPMLNLFVYSLRNADLRNAMRKAKSRILTSWSICGSRLAERRGQPCCGEGC